MPDTVSQEKYDRQRLLFRGQFVLAPRPLDEFPSWKRVKIRDRVWLSAHRDLDVTQQLSGDRSLTMLGYILDPENPKASDADIVAELLPQLCSGDARSNSPLCTERFGGRWLFIADDGKQIRIFTDPLGQNQFCYTGRADGELWGATQPGLLARLLNLEIDPAAQEYVELQLAQGRKEYWWPYDTSIYKGVKQLIPNYYLDFATATPTRFWPDGKFAAIPIRRAVTEGARLIRALLASAANRYPLQLQMTAGWDSRTVLAAARYLTGDITYLTFVRAGLTMESPDVTVPQRLLQKLNRTQLILDVPERMSDEFREIYMQNTAAAHEIWGPIAEALCSLGPNRKVRVTGGGSELVRRQLRPAEEGLTAEDLTHYAGADGRAFALDAISRWLEVVPKELPFGVTDLFYWELKCGNWLAVGQTEWDIIGDVPFTPYNCRRLLTTLMAVNVEYRLAPHYELYRALIKEMWPELLSEPINPHKTLHYDKPSLKSVTKKFLVETHLLDYIPRKYIAFMKKVSS